MAFNTETKFEITFTIKKILYHNPADSFAVLKIETESQTGYKKTGFPKAISAKGIFSDPHQGDKFVSEAHFVEDSQNGYMIEVLGVPKVVLPSSEKEVIEYLKKNIRGVGKKAAESIVERLGVSAIAAIQDNPELVDNVEDLTQKQRDAIKLFARRGNKYDDLLVLLQQMDIPLEYARDIYAEFHDESAAMIIKNPYILYSKNLVPFLIADKMAKKRGWPWNSKFRFVCSLRAAMDWHMENNGDVCVPREMLYKVTNSFIKNSKIYPATRAEIQGEDLVEVTDMPMEDFEKSLQYLIDKQECIVKKINDQEYIYRKEAYAIETTSADLTIDFLRRKPNLAIGDRQIENFLETHYKETFSPEQIQAIQSSLHSGISIITGGPGTGKTFVMQAIVEIIRHFGHEEKTVALMAPTAKAATRMREVAKNAEASTIHSALGLSPFNTVERAEQFPADYVIIDEVSMIDSELYLHILKRLKKDCNLILIGDPGQLPSVGFGSVLRELINSECIPVTELKFIYRQQKGSAINENAARIRTANPEEIAKVHEADDFRIIKPRETKRDDEDFFPSEESRIAEKVVELVYRLHIRKGVPLEDILVLTPIHATECGTISLNNQIQNLLNPAGENDAVLEFDMDREFHIGDRVIHTKNDAKRGVHNGDIGYVTNISADGLTVEFDLLEKPIDYTLKDLEDLLLAYAISVHKSQGSEAQYVIMPFSESKRHKRMLRNNLIYTAITRAKKMFVGVGSMDVLKNGCLRKEDSEERVSLLGEYIRQQALL